MIRPFLNVFIACLLTITASAQTRDAESRYGIETDVLWPVLVQTTRTHFIVKVWQKGHLRGDVYGGLNIDFPRDRETEGRFADYSLATGYRQYLWNGLHLEFSQTTGLGVLEKHVSTGKTYNSFDWLVSGYVGYKFEFGNNKFYVLPQFGVAGVVYKSNPWPIFEDKTLTKIVGESPFMLGTIRFGLNL
jgi:hypothetical protein